MITKKITKDELREIAVQLLEVCEELSTVVSRKASTGACIHDGLRFGQTWEQLNEQLKTAIVRAKYDNPIR